MFSVRFSCFVLLRFVVCGIFCLFRLLLLLYVCDLWESQVGATPRYSRQCVWRASAQAVGVLKALLLCSGGCLAAAGFAGSTPRAALRGRPTGVKVQTHGSQKDPNDFERVSNVAFAPKVWNM